MPWSSPPAAVKERYSERCAAVWVRVANAELERSGDEGRAIRIANTAANNCKESGKAMTDFTTPTPIKASLIDDNHFRLLAIPFGGPLGGRDLDGEYFSERTDIKPDWFSERPVLWHHGQDSLMADTVIGKATDLVREDDGWWVDVWIKAGERRAELVKRLAQKAPIYGSSGTISYLRKASKAGEILVWPYVEQTLTTSPQNALSVAKPAKAWLDDFDSASIPVHDAFKAFLTDLDNLGADLPLTSLPDQDAGDVAAKAGRVLSASNEKRLKEALAVFHSILEEMASHQQSPVEGDSP